MPYPAIRTGFFNSQCVAHLLKIRKMVNEKTIFSLTLSGNIPLNQETRTRIFSEGGQGGIGELQSKLSGNKHSKPLGISLEIHQVRPLVNTHVFLPDFPVGMQSEKIRNSLFAGVPKRRVADIMRQGRRRHDGPNGRCRDAKLRQIRVFGQEEISRPLAQRPADTGDLQTVSKSGMDKGLLGQRKYLCLILEIPKWSRKNNPVVIYFKFTSGRVQARSCCAFSKSFVRQKRFPFHHPQN